MKGMRRAIAMNGGDNVATVLEAVAAGEEVEIIGEQKMRVSAAADIPDAHKIALRWIGEGDGIIKLATRIGTASTAIAAGEWVHLQNVHSDYDRRADGADPTTGVLGDVSYE